MRDRKAAPQAKKKVDSAARVVGHAKVYGDKTTICTNAKCVMRVRAGCSGYEGCPGFKGR